MSKLLALLLLSFASHPLFAQEVQYLGKYYDCLRSTNIVSNSVPLFTIINGKKIRSKYRAGAFTKGLDLSVSTNAQGDIETIHIGPKQDITVAEFENGIEFGVANVTAHVLQLKDFHQNTGGRIEFGFLKKIGAKKNVTKVSSRQDLNEYYSSIFGEHWGTFEISLSRNQVTNQWRFFDVQGDEITTIIGVLTLKNRFMVSGVTDMLAITTRNAQTMTKKGRFMTIQDDQRKFQCEL